MKFIKTSLSGAYIIELDAKPDPRGSFVRTFCKKEFSAIGFNSDFAQMNQSFNPTKGTFRGLHFQRDPHDEARLVRCVAGSALDIFVDLRVGSPTYLQHVSEVISAENLKMVLIPPGFAHGFLTLEDNTSLIYHHTEYYYSELADGVRYDDPKLKIKLPAPITVINPRDEQYPLLPT